MVRAHSSAAATLRHLLDDLRRNHLAGSAPRSEAVEYEECILDLKRRIPVGLATTKVSPRNAEMHDVAGPSPETASAGDGTRARTHVCRLCTPSLLMVLVFEKNLGLRMGR